MYFTSNNSIYDIFFNAIYIFSFYTNIVSFIILPQSLDQVYFKTPRTISRKNYMGHWFSGTYTNNNFRLGIFQMYNTSISIYSPLHFSVWDMNQEIIYVGTTYVSTYTIIVATRMMIV
jgi:hypothetical protein